MPLAKAFAELTGTPGKGLEKPYVKHGKKYKYNPGAPGAMVLAGVGHGRVLA